MNCVSSLSYIGVYLILLLQAYNAREIIILSKLNKPIIYTDTAQMNSYSDRVTNKTN